MFFEETKTGVFERNKNVHIKNKNFWADENFKEIDDFVSNSETVLQISLKT